MRNCVEIIRAVNVNVDILTFWHVWLCNTFNMKTRLSRVYFLIWSGREVFATILEMEFAKKVQKKKKKKKIQNSAKAAMTLFNVSVAIIDIAGINGLALSGLWVGRLVDCVQNRRLGWSACLTIRGLSYW